MSQVSAVLFVSAINDKLAVQTHIFKDLRELINHKNKIAHKLNARFKNINLREAWLGERLQRDMYDVAEGFVPAGRYESRWFKKDAPRLVSRGLENPTVKARVAKGMSPLNAVSSTMADARDRAIRDYVNTKYYVEQLKKLRANPGDVSYMERYLPGLEDAVRSQVENFR